MKKYFISISIFLLFLSGCSVKDDKPAAAVDNENDLVSLVLSAVNGNKKANDSLSQIVDNRLPPGTEPNKTSVTEFRTKEGLTFYYVLLEYPNPLYSRFAVYDSMLSLYLLHKDLNGFLSADMFSMNGVEFLQLKESFLSKSIIKLNKLNIIVVDSAQFTPALEIYTGITAPKIVYNQVITEFNKEYIRTSITGPDSLKEEQKEDVFLFNPSRKRYISNENKFRQIVEQIVNKFESSSEFEITDTNTSAE